MLAQLWENHGIPIPTSSRTWEPGSTQTQLSANIIIVPGEIHFCPKAVLHFQQGNPNQQKLGPEEPVQHHGEAAGGLNDPSSGAEPCTLFLYDSCFVAARAWDPPSCRAHF